MDDIPEATAEINPEVLSMVAIVLLLLVQIPPEVVFENVVVVPGQIGDVPVMPGTKGYALTLNVVVAALLQPVVALVTV